MIPKELRTKLESMKDWDTYLLSNPEKFRTDLNDVLNYLPLNVRVELANLLRHPDSIDVSLFWQLSIACELSSINDPVYAPVIRILEDGYCYTKPDTNITSALVLWLHSYVMDKQYIVVNV